MSKAATPLRVRMLRVGGVVYLVLASGIALLLGYLHTQALEAGHKLARTHAQTMSEQTARVLDATDQRLQLVQVRLEQLERQRQLDAPSAMQVLQDQLKGQPYLNRMWYLNAAGVIVYDSQPGTVGISLADRAFYVTHLGGTATSLYVDSPVLSRRTGKMQLSVSRPWRTADGALRGMLVAAVDVSYFETLWRTADLEAGGVASLFKPDGTMLMRSPFDAGAVGRNFKHQPLFTVQLAQASEGSYVDSSSVDGIRRVFAYSTLDSQPPLVLVAGIATDVVLRSWRNLAWLVAALTLAGSLVAGLLTRSLLRAVDAGRRAQADAQLRAYALEAITQGVMISGVDRLTVSVNRAFEQLTGYSAQEMIGRSCKLLQGPMSDAATTAEFKKALDAGQAITREVLNYRKDGSAFWNEVTISPVVDAQGKVTHFVGIQHDVTERKSRHLQLRMTEQVFHQAREGITITDAARNIVLVNPAFTHITGYTDVEVMGKNPRVLASGLQDRACYTAMWAAIEKEGVWSGEIYNRHKDGTVYPEWLTISVIRDELGNITNYLGSFSDLTQVRAAENRVQKLTHYDPLTALPNRTLLQDRTAHCISMVQRSQEPFCMMLLSIDHFKALNDTLGHKVGDTVLVEMARRLSDAVRDQDTVSHHSGKEFTLILPGTSADGAAHLASELLWKIAQPCGVADQQLSVTASIGLSVFPDNGHDFDTLYKSAEIALHRAQASGRDDFKFYSEGMYQEVLARETMTKALRFAAVRGELQVLYQPLADLQTGKISGMEALLRWHHPELGTVSPMVFIPIAEDTGLIRGIGEWVLRQVCADLRSWLDQGLDAPHVAVNVSPVQFRDPAFLALIQVALKDFNMEPGRIHLEVTESALMEDVQRCEDILRALKKMGFFLSLDDFGTGYSSLSYLKRYPFDKVKIDQSFVRDIGSSQADSVIVKVIISMAHGLGLKVIAEGVETEAQCEIMRTNVCDEIQGYFFSRPVDAETVKGLMLANKQLPVHLLRFRPKQRTLLLVDDEPNVISSLKRLFRQDGHAIVTANSGAEGLAVLATQKVDVIISDQRMPGMTGVEFLREAKLKYPDTIRIVLSGYTELQSVTDAINEGAIYRFLTKPWDDAQLREQISKAFKHKELLEENQQLDIKIRTTNQELVAANRHLGDVIHSTRQQIDADSTSLAIVREALEFIPTPVLGLDDEQVVIFANAAAEAVWAGTGSVLGLELMYVSEELFKAVSSLPQGAQTALQIGGTAFDVRWNVMGKTSRSRGKLVTMMPSLAVC
jgi:diguanylate cyclase (GGDEF)-like protein/PAS domain S-box-containing protein